MLNIAYGGDRGLVKRFVKKSLAESFATDDLDYMRIEIIYGKKPEKTCRLPGAELRSSMVSDGPFDARHLGEREQERVRAAAAEALGGDFAVEAFGQFEPRKLQAHAA
jgi:hypothetical protein